MQRNSNSHQTKPQNQSQKTGTKFKWDDNVIDHVKKDQQEEPGANGTVKGDPTHFYTCR